MTKNVEYSNTYSYKYISATEKKIAVSVTLHLWFVKDEATGPNCKRFWASGIEVEQEIREWYLKNLKVVNIMWCATVLNFGGNIAVN